MQSSCRVAERSAAPPWTRPVRPGSPRSLTRGTSTPSGIASLRRPAGRRTSTPAPTSSTTGTWLSYTGPAVDQLTNIGFNDDGCDVGSGTGSVLDFAVTAGTTYSIAVDGWEVEVGDFTLTYTIPGGPPPPPPRRHLRLRHRHRHRLRHLRHRHLRRLRHLRLRLRLRLRRAAASRASSGCASAPRRRGSGVPTARSATCAAFARGDRCAAVSSPEPEARHDQAPELPGQAGGRQELDHQQQARTKGACESGRPSLWP